MASLQKYQGRGKDAGKTFFRIQPYLPCGKRVTIRLGTGSKNAATSSRAIDDLIDSKKAGDDAGLNATTRSWLAEIADQSICQTLLALGLIDQIPARFSPEQSSNCTISKLADEYIRTRGSGQADSTIILYRKGKKNLLECFGDVGVESLTKRDGREFWRWLLEDKGLAENTAKQRLRFARSFFELAIEDELTTVNPFRARGLTVAQTAAEKTYVTEAEIDRIIEHCPSTEWKLLFALCRSVPVRVPSEIRELTWSDVDWENNTMLIHSPKTRRLGKSARLVPIFERLEPWLSKAFNEAEDGEQYVFPVLRNHTNVAKIAGDIITRAKILVWTKLFNSLRATTETDLMDQYGLRRACQWAGNSPATAMKNYALVRKTDFIDAGSIATGEQKVDAKSDAIFESDAKCAAVPASTIENDSSRNPTKKALSRTVSLNSAILMGAEGLEPPTLSV